MAEVVVQSLSRVWFFATPWTAAHQASLSFTVSWSWFRFVSTELVMLSNHHILCYPLLLLPSIFPSNRVFANELALPMGCLKYWRFSFSISPSNEFSGLIFFCIDWFDLLAVQETFKCLIQHYSSKASVLQFSAFFCGPSLTSTVYFRKNPSFDYTDHCQQSNVSAFYCTVWVCHGFPSKNWVS